MILFSIFCLMCLPCWCYFSRGLIFSPPNWIITNTLFRKGSVHVGSFPANERTSSSWNASGQLNLPRPTTKKDLLLYTGKMAVVWRLLRSGHPTTHPTPVRTVLRANSASNLHRIGNGTRGPGGLKCGFRGKSFVLRLSCASISFLGRWRWPLFWLCVCRFVSVCVSLVFSSSSWFALQSNSTARRRETMLLFSANVFFFEVMFLDGRSFSLSLSQIWWSFGSIVFASQFIVHSFRLNHHICCNMQLFLLFLTQSTRWK